MPVQSPIVLILDGQSVTAHDVARFWEKVTRSPGNKCWLWKGKPNHSGYGRLHVGGRNGRHLLAHRLSRALAYPGEDIANLEVCHECDNPPCVNPIHLFVGTHLDNMKDRDRKGRVTRGDEHWTARKPERKAKGENHGASRLTESKVLAIRSRYAAGGQSYGDLATEYDVSPGTIRDVVKRRRWKHLP